MKWIWGIIALLIIIALGFVITTNNIAEDVPARDDVDTPIAEIGDDEEDREISVIAQNLEIPWDIVWLPKGGMLVTQRPGELVRINEDKTTFPIEGVAHIGEGGLLGMALHPQFEENSYVYLYLTTQSPQGLTNRVVRYVLENDTLRDETIIVEGIPAGRIHDGGRMAFGPDSMLYITTGDAGNPSFSQDTSNVAGKILRVHDDGSVPNDNPFDNEVYSYGHRNPQGIAWDDEGRMWSTEHGATALDEINRIERGRNYGWPVIEGDETREGMETPVVHSGRDTTWAPAGMAFWDGRLFFGGLRGSSLYEAIIHSEDDVEVRTHFSREFGRIRAVSVGPDSALYIGTSNRDGRGQERDGDDKIIRIPMRTIE